ncbi:MAG: hypothetical protein RSE48_00165 [Bacilli bacterium]
MKFLGYEVIANKDFVYTFIDEDGKRKTLTIPVRIDGKINPLATEIVGYVKSEIEKQRREKETNSFIEQVITKDVDETQVMEPVKEKHKVTYKKGTDKLKKKRKKFLLIAVMALALKVGTTFIPNTTFNDITNEEQEATIITEDILVNATTELQGELKNIGIQVSNKEVLYFITLINIDTIKENNSELLVKIFADTDFDNVKNSADYVIGELASTSISNGENIYFKSFIFNNIDKEIYQSIKDNETKIKDAVLANDYEEIQSLIGVNYYKPLTDFEGGYLLNNGDRVYEEPTMGVRYLMEELDSILILNMTSDQIFDGLEDKLNNLPNNDFTKKNLEERFNDSLNKGKSL